MYATDELKHEHKIILMLLEALEGATEKLEKCQVVPLNDLEEMVNSIRTFADTCHHGKEEDLLFPALNQAGLPSDMGPVSVMLHEHEMGRAFVRGMANALVDMKTNSTGSMTFADNANGYIGLLRNHINKENNILFVMAERMLPETEHTRLLAEFAALEKDRIGEGIHEKLHQQVHDWHKTYAEV